MILSKILKSVSLNQFGKINKRNIYNRANKVVKNEIINYTQKRTYLHFTRTLPEDYELPLDTFPDNINEILASNKKNHDFIQSYWYWKIRSESNLLNYEKLIKKSYKQLAIDLGMQVHFFYLNCLWKYLQLYVLLLIFILFIQKFAFFLFFILHTLLK